MLSAALLAALLTRAAQAGPVEDLVGKLEKQGYSFQDPARHKALLDAVGKAADPRARAVTTAEKAREEERARGLAFQTGIRCASSNDTLQVLELLPASPAIHAGVLARSILVAVNGHAVASNRLTAALQLLRGGEQGKILLEWKTPEGVARKTELPLSLLPEPPVQLQELLPGGFGYLRLNGVYSDSGEWISRLLLKWDRERCPGLLLDLRDAGGNDLESALRIGGLSAATGAPLVTLRPRDGSPSRAAVAAEGDSLSMPILVLVNGATRGAAEMLAAILQRGGRGAMLVGESTAGDPLVRDYIAVDKGLYLRLAVREALFPDGSRLDGANPLVPDIRVEDRDLAHALTASMADWDVYAGDRAKTPDAEAMALATRVGRDAVLQRGVDILLGLRALNIRTAERAPRPQAPTP